MALNPIMKALKAKRGQEPAVFELKAIELIGHRYPWRATTTRTVGLFDSRGHAEQALQEYIDFLKCISGSSKVYHNDYLCFMIGRRRVNTGYLIDYPGWAQWTSYTADGELNDQSWCDKEGKFEGCPAESIRFMVGDIVEVLVSGGIELAIVESVPSTTEQLKSPMLKRGLAKSSDSYTVHLLNGGHLHSACYEVFRPTHKIPTAIAQQLRERLREALETFS